MLHVTYGSNLHSKFFVISRNNHKARSSNTLPIPTDIEAEMLRFAQVLPNSKEQFFVG
jgi:hypothetical protein